MSFSAQYVESLVKRLAALETEVTRLKAQKQAISSGGAPQRIIPGRVVALNGTTPETYQVRMIVGKDRVETNYILSIVTPIDADAVYSPGDYVTVCKPTQGTPFIMAGGGSSGEVTYIIPIHAHRDHLSGGALPGFAGGL